MLKIGKIKISKTEKPKIIAEISGNHNRNINRALKLIRLAANKLLLAVDEMKKKRYNPNIPIVVKPNIRYHYFSSGKD